MAEVGDLVKPNGRDGTWRLGRVESVEPDGRYRVRAFVAPAGAYEGTVGTYAEKEIAVVPVIKVIGYLETLRAELATRHQLERQITEALRAFEAELVGCSCGGSPGAHEHGCALARVLRQT